MILYHTRIIRIQFNSYLNYEVPFSFLFFFFLKKNTYLLICRNKSQFTSEGQSWAASPAALCPQPLSSRSRQMGLRLPGCAADRNARHRLQNWVRISWETLSRLLVWGRVAEKHMKWNEIVLWSLYCAFT